MQLIIEPGQTIKFVADAQSAVTFHATAFGQHCFVADTAQQIKNQTINITQSTVIHAFNASFETMTVTLTV